MRGARSARQWGWRWRRNPLRRRDDVFEAWLLLFVWIAFGVGGTFAGLMTARAADESFSRLRDDRHAIHAVLVDSTRSGSSAARGADYDHVRATVRWTTPDGSSHTGRALVKAGHKAGSDVVIWMTAQGRLTTAPPSTGATAAAVGLLGVGAALALGGLGFAVGGFARWWLDRRRYGRLTREWERLGPQWGHKTS
ncbi:hypothetical protein ACN6K9_005822 [Streptomyces sp. SAS_267]|uniref:Rv1733c family protein n=1 Tax=Streptomyces sp. SAS_267 TaxID=3412750 RepID=UPI00403C8FE9